MRACVVSDHEQTSAKVRQALLRHGHDCPLAQVYALDLAAVHLTTAPTELAVVVLSLVEGVAFRAPLEQTWPGDAAAELVAEFVTGGYVRVEAGSARAAESFDAAASEGGPPHS